MSSLPFVQDFGKPHLSTHSPDWPKAAIWESELWRLWKWALAFGPWPGCPPATCLWAHWHRHSLPQGEWAFSHQNWLKKYPCCSVWCLWKGTAGGSFSKVSVPWTQVNLKTGVPPDSINETCTAGAGSLLVEFGILSRLIGDSTFEWVARRAVRALWRLRSNETGLLGELKITFMPAWVFLFPVLEASSWFVVRGKQVFLFIFSFVGNVINIQTGQWVGKQSGLGAGMDSFYEYLLKSYILFGEEEDNQMFQAAYESIQNHLRRGWAPLFIFFTNVVMQMCESLLKFWKKIKWTLK